MMQASKARGFSLAEVLMTCAVLALFITMVTELFVTAYRSHIQSSQKLANLRSASITLDRISRQMAACDRLYYPDPALPPMSVLGSSFSATAAPFVFRCNTATGPKVFGYRLDASNKTIKELIYKNDFDPADPSKQTVTAHKDLSPGEEELKLTHIQVNSIDFVTVSLKLKAEVHAMSMDIRVRSL